MKEMICEHFIDVVRSTLLHFFRQRLPPGRISELSKSCDWCEALSFICPSWRPLRAKFQSSTKSATSANIITILRTLSLQILRHQIFSFSIDVNASHLWSQILKLHQKSKEHFRFSLRLGASWWKFWVTPRMNFTPSGHLARFFYIIHGARHSPPSLQLISRGSTNGILGSSKFRRSDFVTV